MSLLHTEFDAGVRGWVTAELGRAVLTTANAIRRLTHPAHEDFVFAMIQVHYRDAPCSSGELDALISDARRTRTLPGTLDEDDANNLPRRRKKPRRIGAFRESGRPGSNRRRPAWEATEAAAAEALK
jgi:hypothetical protein